MMMILESRIHPAPRVADPEGTPDEWQQHKWGSTYVFFQPL